MNKKTIYLDYNATTPTHPEVVEAMLPYFTERFGNASSVHAFGRETRYAVEVAREKIARFIGAASEEILFTSGGTEANNLAIKGTAMALRGKGNHLITSQIEHSSILKVCRELEAEGFQVTYLPVDKGGRINPKDLEKALTPQTLLVTLMHANNEIGTIEPVSEMAKMSRGHAILFHTDAIQSLGKIPLNVQALGVDLLSVSGHKISGPKGIGFLYKRIGTMLHPQILGGSHERNLRAGTESVPLIVGIGKAVEILEKTLQEKNQKIQNLRDTFEKKIKAKIPDTLFLGDPENRLPNTSALCFSGLDGNSLMRQLDLEGVAVSTGSACMSGAVSISHVLAAIGLPEKTAIGSVRFSFGEQNTEGEVDQVVSLLAAIVPSMQDKT